METRNCIAVDVGGTNLRVALCTPDLRLTFRKEYPATPSGEDDPGPAALMESIADALAEFSGAFHIDFGTLRGIGISTGGIVDAENGRFVGTASRKPAYQNYPMIAELSKRVPCANIRMENDAKAAALGEMTGGGARDLKDFIYLGVGTGIGGAIILDGRPLCGQDHSAGHFGRFIVRNPQPVGPAFLTLEELASGSGMEARAAALLAAGRESTLSAPVHAKDIFSAAAEGDALAAGVVEDAASSLASVLSGLVCTLGVQSIVIGGGVAVKNPGWVQELIRVYRGISPKLSRDARFHMAQLGEDAGLIGAAALV